MIPGQMGMELGLHTEIHSYSIPSKGLKWDDAVQMIIDCESNKLFLFFSPTPFAQVIKGTEGGLVSMEKIFGQKFFPVCCQLIKPVAINSQRPNQIVCH